MSVARPYGFGCCVGEHLRSINSVLVALQHTAIVLDAVPLTIGGTVGQ